MLEKDGKNFQILFKEEQVMNLGNEEKVFQSSVQQLTESVLKI